MRGSFLCFFLVFAGMHAVQAQRRVIVPEGFGTLNEIIRKDTLAGGVRKNPNTVYVLKRGGVYALSGTILTSGFHLRLEAEEGTGPRPFVRMGFLEGGTQVEEIFEVRGDLTFRGIHFTAINEFNTYIARLVSASSPGLRLRFYDCFIDGSGQTFLRINSSGCKVYMLNSTISRMGRPSNPDNGRVIDDRGNPIDSIVVENNTWYNITSRVIRDGGAEINYVKLNQNTFVNVGQRFAAIGQVNVLELTNNIIVNPRFLGNSTTSPIVSLEFTPFGPNPRVNLSHNNFYFEREVTNAWATLTSQGTARVPPPLVVAANQSFVNTSVGLISEPLAFTARPMPPTQFIILSESGQGSTVPDWDWTGAATSNPWELNALAYHNFSYPISANSFRASSKGEPLGDLRWFPNYEVAWSVMDLVQQALALVKREQDNPVITADATALNALQSQITAAASVAGDPRSSGIALATARNSLRQSMQSFRASLVITATPKQDIAFVAFPNPCQDQLLVRLSTVQKVTAIVFSITAQPVARIESNGQDIQIDTRGWTPGIYVLEVRTASARSTLKIVKL